MKKEIFLIPLAGAVIAVSILGAKGIGEWTWQRSTEGNKINYCLLIGQTDHNDSAARTAGIRDALGTRVPMAEGNENVETTKVAVDKEFEGKTSGKKKKFTVTELDHQVSVADSGATWDQARAVTISSSWYTKYGKNLTFVVSNNDGMAEGATFALNCPKNMPIFGYDSNESTLKLIKAGKIAGTINSNAPAQATIFNVLACRIIDALASLKQDIKDGKTVTNDQIKTALYGNDGKDKKLFNWFDMSYDGGKTHKVVDPTEAGLNDLYLKSGMKDFLGNDIVVNYDENNRALLVSSNSVNKHNVEEYDVPMANQTVQGFSDNPKQTGFNFFQTCYSMTDTYLKTTMNPLVNVVTNKLKIDTYMAYGNGNDEGEVLNKIGLRDNVDAYIINMTKTSNVNLYIDKLKEKLGPLFPVTPIIFYNRQPNDSSYLKGDEKGNYCTFYVGFDAKAGAKKQGDLITDWIGDQIDSEA